MKKRILVLTLGLAMLLVSVTAFAEAKQRYTGEELSAAIDGKQLTVVWVNLGGAWMDIADGETQVYLEPGTRVYFDPEQEVPAGYYWIYVYQQFIAADGTLVWRMVGQGLVDADAMSLEQPKMPSVFNAYKQVEPEPPEEYPESILPPLR